MAALATVNVTIALAAMFAGVAGLATGTAAVLANDWTPRFLVALAFLSLVGTAAAFLAWFAETLRSPLGVLAAWTFLVPVAGVVFAAILLSEAPTGWTAIGIVLVLASLWVVLHPAPEPGLPELSAPKQPRAGLRGFPGQHPVDVG